MKRKVVLLAILLAIAAPAATAGESGTNKPVTSQTDPSAGEYKLDFQELFGCKPMGEDGYMPMPKPASGVSQQEAMQPTQKHDMQEKY
ncbi:MAG TPA: hypothetical protein VFQ94_00015 [Gallionella sp.]|nr:hypothetical protein [Gallionella sp.]